MLYPSSAFLFASIMAQSCSYTSATLAKKSLRGLSTKQDEVTSKNNHRSTLSISDLDIYCDEPIMTGEVRNWADKSQCIDPDGIDGKGNINTYLCEGYNDQTFKFCKDGTIRNVNSGYCLDVAGSSGSGNIEMWPCEISSTGGISEDQQWDRVYVGEKTETENGIVKQKPFQIKNRKSGLCIDISGSSGRGSIQTWSCDGGLDQQFYVRSRGDVIDSGKLKNKESNWCLDVEGSDGLGEIMTYNCEDELDQVFTLYENGELVNEKSKQCVDIEGLNGSGNIQISPCEAQPDQQWKVPFGTDSDGYFSLASKKSEQCLDVGGLGVGDGKGNVQTANCAALDDQKWTWIAPEYTTPVGSWVPVACHGGGDGGQLTRRITNSVSSTESLTSTTAVSIAVTMGGGMDFGVKSVKAETTVTVTQEISKQWSTSWEKTESRTTSCDISANNEICLWQYHIETTSTSADNNKVTWNTLHTRCNEKDPICPPFTECVDSDCQECVKKI